MDEPEQPKPARRGKRFNTGTVMAAFTAWWIVLEDYVVGLEKFITDHSHGYLQFAADHPTALKMAIASTIALYLGDWHTSGDQPANDGQ